MPDNFRGILQNFLGTIPNMSSDQSKFQGRNSKSEIFNKTSRTCNFGNLSAIPQILEMLTLIRPA